MFWKRKVKPPSIEEMQEQIRKDIKADLCAELDKLKIEVRHWEDCFPSSVGPHLGSEYLHRFENAIEVKEALLKKLNEILHLKLS